MDEREAARRCQAEAYALFEKLRHLLRGLPDDHPARPGLHAAAVAAYCHWRECLIPIREAG